jgi:2-C-methyl-D-erythritol 2,4-cyclodiphosphate synthase
MMPSETDHSTVPLTMRIGHGYDLHRLEPRPPHGRGREFILAGVKFPNHPVGPVSHSDGDAAYHAVTDAILGALGPALGGGDIGELFPDTDPQHDGADSSIFLRESTRRMQQAGYGVGNIDITIICERPKISPHKSKMIANIAHALSCEPHRVNIKGKTHEQVDAIGEGRAVEVHAVVTLLLTMQ